MLKVKVVNIEIFEPCDEHGSFCIGPERLDIQLEGINCSVHEFVDLFLHTEEGQKFCSIRGGLSDIGGSSLSLAPGTILTVCYEDCREYRLKQWEIEAKAEIQLMCSEALRRLGVTLSPDTNHFNDRTARLVVEC